MSHIQRLLITATVITLGLFNSAHAQVYEEDLTIGGCGYHIDYRAVKAYVIGIGRASVPSTVSNSNVPHHGTAGVFPVEQAGYRGSSVPISSDITCVTLPVSTIGINAFAGSANSCPEFEVSMSVAILKNAFAGNTNLKKISSSVMTDAITSESDLGGSKVYESAFEGCTSLTDYDVWTKSIADNAFKGCSALTHFDFTPLQSLGKDAFSGCTALTDIRCARLTPPALSDASFDSEIYATATLRVPVESIDAYLAAPGWRNFTNITYIKVYPAKVTIDAERVDLFTGQSQQLAAELTAASAVTERGVVWTSSMPEVATVDDSGMVTALSRGTATITATTDNGRSATCTISVTKPVESVKIGTVPDSSKEMLLYVGGSAGSFHAEVLPRDTDYPSLTWTISDPKVATVTDLGTVKPLAPGTTTVTATSHNGISDMATVTVYQPVTGITLTPAEAELDMAETLQLSALCAPANATVKDLVWKASDINGTDDTDVLSVDETGLVTPLTTGKAMITVTPVHGHCAATTIISVERVDKGISLDITEHRGIAGDQFRINATLDPADTTTPDLLWESSNNLVASVDQTGLVTLHGSGSATVTVTSAHGYQAQCTFKVYSTTEIYHIELSKATAEMCPGESVKLSGKYNYLHDIDSFGMPLQWRSSDESVATVDADGTVHALKPGNATVTAAWYAVDAACDIEVIVPVESICFESPSVTLTATYLNSEGGVLKSDQLPTPVVLPANAKYRDISQLDWSSSDPDVLPVYESYPSGLHQLSMLAYPGTTTLTATTHNGLKASIDVTVIVPLESLYPQGDRNYNMQPGDTRLLEVKASPARHSETLSWTSSDEDVATVDANGLVTAKNPGVATIYCKASGGQETYWWVSVLAERRLIFDQTEISAMIGRDWYMPLQASLLLPAHPEDAESKITWSVDNPEIVSLDDFSDYGSYGVSCTPTPLKAGTTTIRAKTETGLEAECLYTAIQPATSISLSDNAVTLRPGDTWQLQATLLPEDTSDKTLSWSSYNDAIATVSPDGLVTAIDEGWVLISAECNRAYGQAYIMSRGCQVTVSRSAHLGSVVIDGGVTITPTDDGIIINGALSGPFTVRTPDGRTIYHGSDRHVTGLAHGVYLITCGTHTTKLRL